VKNHAERMWACDFIQTHDHWFRQVYAFFIVHVASRRVVHVAATCHPTQAWTAQQLRNATMDGDAPAVLVRDRDDKFGPAFDRVAQCVGAKVIRTAVRAPNRSVSSRARREHRSKPRVAQGRTTRRESTAGIHGIFVPVIHTYWPPSAFQLYRARTARPELVDPDSDSIHRNPRASSREPLGTCPTLGFPIFPDS
jgi:hypothetical protein